jgi:hypothetical protein
MTDMTPYKKNKILKYAANVLGAQKYSVDHKKRYRKENTLFA